MKRLLFVLFTVGACTPQSDAPRKDGEVAANGATAPFSAAASGRGDGPDCSKLLGVWVARESHILPLSIEMSGSDFVVSRTIQFYEGPQEQRQPLTCERDNYLAVDGQTTGYRLLEAEGTMHHGGQTFRRP